MWAQGKEKQMVLGTLEPFFFSFSFSFSRAQPPRRVILVCTPTAGAWPARGPAGTPSQTARGGFVCRRQELHRWLSAFCFNTGMSVSGGELAVRGQ